MRKTFVQGGSVKVFVIVGVILTAIALGVLYVAGRQATSSQVPPMFVPDSSQDEQKDDKKSDTTSSDQTKDGTDASDTTGKDKDSSNDASTGDATDTTDGSQTTGDTEDGTSTNTADEDSQQPADLPKTGAADGVAGAIVLAMLTFSAVAYVRSLRRF